MKLTYIYHSGFAIEGDGYTIVFDFWRDPSGVMPALLKRPGRLYVFASHFHEDHFNPEIFTWRDSHPDICYILSKDILRHRKAPREAATAWLAKGATFADDILSVSACGSTDVGVSWLVRADGKTIFHAGDLNNWHWTDESTSEEVEHAEKMYLGELKDIRKQTENIDVAFFPVDARIGSDYMRGARQFVERFRIGLFVPMHFSANGFSSIVSFGEFATLHDTRYWAIANDGATFE